MSPAIPPIDVWVATGESRAVAATVSSHFRQRLAERVPEAGSHLDTDECIQAVLASEIGDQAREIAGILRALERARFSPAAPGDVLDIVDQTEALLDRLGAVPETP
jgi:hypothetical protein